MKRCVLFLAVAATASAVTIREATCSHSYYQSGELVSVVQTSGTSGCTAGEFDGVYASARNDFQISILPDRAFLYADTDVMARGAEDQERDAQVLGSARTVIEVSLTGITAGPVRPGLLYVSGSFLTSRPSGSPGPSPRMSVTLGDVELADPEWCWSVTDGCEIRGLSPRANFTLGVPFPIRILVEADTGVTSGLALAVSSGGFDIRFAEEGPCPDHECDTFVGGFQIVPEPSTGLLVVLPVAAAAVLLRRRARSI